MSIVNYAIPVRKAAAKLDSPKWEAAKLVGRWVLFFLIASALTDVLRQIDVVPERACYDIGTGFLCLTIRENVRLLLTLALGYVEQYVHKKNKMDSMPSGFIPF